jgi:GrpB-like predicted nucleotidyltransferase (UPF0157 family)/quercetin dioxygenase-like cupin family protein
VRLFRFDEEVSVPVTEAGSRFRVGPLTGDGARGRVEVVHLPPGGRIARQAVPVPQLLAVVSGTGRVGGGGGEVRAVRPGAAALWDAGEEREATTEGGLTAVRVEGDFDVWAMGVTQDIVVSDYDPAWPSWFETVRRRVWPAVQDVAVRIDHVGSTSVPGLAAKPIIDMDIVVASEADVRPVIERLAAAGYRWRGDLGVTGRQAFKLVRDEGLPPHQLYVVVEDNKAHLDHWLLRDLLREDADARERYAALKRQNVVLANRSIEVYVAAKAALVAELLTRARVERGFPPEQYWAPDVDAI